MKLKLHLDAIEPGIAHGEDNYRVTFVCYLSKNELWKVLSVQNLQEVEVNIE